MLALSAFGAVGQEFIAPPLVERLTPKDVARILASAGYSVQPTNSNGIRGKVSRDGMTVDFKLSIPDFPTDEGLHSGISGIEISGEIPIGEDPAVHEPQRILYARGNNFYLTTTSHLVRTTTLWADRGFGQEWSAKAIRLLFDNFWREGSAYARPHRGAFVTAPDRDWSKVHFAGSLTIDQDDMISFVRAMDSWRYKRTGAILKPGAWPRQDCVVRDQTVCVSSGVYGNEGNVRGFVLSAILSLPSGTNADVWIGAHHHQMKGLRFTNGFRGGVIVKEVVSVFHGLRLRNMRRKVEAFSRTIKDLKSSFLSS